MYFVYLDRKVLIYILGTQKFVFDKFKIGMSRTKLYLGVKHYNKNDFYCIKFLDQTILTFKKLFIS